ncbi:uncharacterized protein LOC143613864 [Bidens hawaiensis]|uniref:uncharacterized protein LOC143613864 n=1 Tax=Bidens hawaiensis TaxID=980011 RepID=UPI00404A85E3
MADKETMKKSGGSGNPNAFQSPMLTCTNYKVCTIQMKVLLNVHKVWNTIDSGTTDDDKNNIAIALIYQLIPEATIMQVGNLDSAKEIWNAIKTRNLVADWVKEARLQTLMNEFDGMRMKDTETIDEFVAKLSCTASKAAILGEMIEETKMVKKFLSSLPRKKFIQSVASLEQNLDLKTVGFEDVVGRLKAYKERIREEDMHSETQGKLMFQKSESSSSRYNDRESTRGGRGCGGGRGRGGRGSGQNRGHQENNMNRENCEHKGKTRDLSKVQCYRCDEFMMKRNFKVIPGNYESKDGDDWYLDNGASNHMTGNMSFFSELNNRVTGKVKFGDHSYVDISGKGSILYEAKSGEHRLLTDVYFIPSLRNNIVSLGQASEHGCDIHIKDNYLTMYDGKIGKPVCLLSRIEETSWLWHARLGHLNFESIKLMARRDMVEGMRDVTNENKLCEPCLVGKQMRQSFPNSAAFRATRALELVHGDLCGPITPPTIAGNRYVFVLIDDYSPFVWTYLLKAKDEAFEAFKKFKELVESDVGKKIKTFRTDRGGEFTSHEFNQFSEIQDGTEPYWT